MRHLGGKRRRFDLKLYGKPIAKADLLYLKIAAKEFCFFLERDQLLAWMVES